MSLTEQINADIKKAMIAKEKGKLASLRAIKSELLLLATGKSGSDISTEDELKVLQKMVKQRKDSAAVYEDQNRADLAKDELEQLEYISIYLPKQMTADEVRIEVKAIIEQLGASGPADMGKVMGLATKKLTGKADGKTIASITKELLTS